MTNPFYWNIEMTIENLSRLYELVIKAAIRRGDTPLHGLCPTGESRLSLFPIPYGVFIHVGQQTDKSKRYDLEFLQAAWCLHDSIDLLLRATQRLGQSLELATQTLGNDHHEFQAQKDGVARMQEVDSHEFAVRFHRSNDVSIDLDAAVVYARSIADLIGKTLPSIVQDPPYRFRRGSLREVMKHAQKQPNSPLGKLFADSRMEWFHILAGKRKAIEGGQEVEFEGMRDARLHTRVIRSVVGQSVQSPGEPPGPVAVTVQEVGLRSREETRFYSADLAGPTHQNGHRFPAKSSVFCDLSACGR